jgi:hypothetical protein
VFRIKQLACRARVGNVLGERSVDVRCAREAGRTGERSGIRRLPCHGCKRTVCCRAAIGRLRPDRQRQRPSIHGGLLRQHAAIAAQVTTTPGLRKLHGIATRRRAVFASREKKIQLLKTRATLQHVKVAANVPLWILPARCKHSMRIVCLDPATLINATESQRMCRGVTKSVDRSCDNLPVPVGFSFLPDERKGLALA